MDYLDNIKKQGENTNNQEEKKEEPQQNQQKKDQEDKFKLDLKSHWYKSPQFNPSLLQKINDIGNIDLKQNENNQAFILGICGGSSAGKTLLSQLLRAKLREIGYQATNIDHFIPILKQTDFYHKRPQCPPGVDEDKFKAEYLATHNFDQPSAIDWDYMLKCLKFLKTKNPVDIPIYNMDNETREKKTKKIKQKADIVIVEGTLLFNNEKFRDMCDLKIFLDSDEDTRLSRRVYKDCCIRNKPLPEVLDKYRKFTKEAFEKYTFPTKKYADIVIPNFGGDYSTTKFQGEQSAGFSTIDNGVVLLVLNLLGNRLAKLKEHQVIEEANSENSSPSSSPLITKNSGQYPIQDIPMI